MNNMYKHKIERADFDSHATDFLDKYLNDGWILLSHTVYASGKGVNFTRSSSGYQHVLVFQKYTPELDKNNTVSEEMLNAALDEFAVKDVFSPK